MKVKILGYALVSLLVACGLTAGPANPALATSQLLSQVVSAAPATGTPSVDDGTVLAYAQVGTTMVAGGSFTSVAGSARRGVFAFSTANNQISSAFSPVLDGDVDSLWPGPTAGTVYVAGAFNNVNGVKNKGLVLLDLSTGQRVSTFRVLSMNGIVNTVRLAGSHLYVGGTFTNIGGVNRAGLASLNPTTGAVDTQVQNVVATNHNWTSTNGAAKAAVGVTDLDVTPDGSKMVIIGNFKTVDGLPRDQVAVLDLSGAQSAVQPDWRTRGYEPACYSWAYDSYVRDVDIAPDGSWFAIAATGGGNTTLCDTVARFQFGATGDDIQPAWRSVAGGDSLLSVAIAGDVTYAGGHQRWMNNDNGNDSAGAGAVPRPGLVALDSRTGVPVGWNPGRNPRGSGAWAAYVTSSGLWVGSDTDWIGDHTYRRNKMAFFPLAGGSPLAGDAVKPLPGGIYTGSTSSGSNVLYRVDAAGPELAATDGGPNWAADDGPSSPYHNDGASTAGYSPSVTLDSTVPAGTPSALFDTERWDPGSKGDGGELSWTFPVPSGTQVNVRLFFANRYSGTGSTGQRVFDVAVEGRTVLEDFDIVAAAGDQTGTMRQFTVTSDGTIDIALGHEVENPLINGIEIATTAAAQPPSTTTSRTNFDGSTASAPAGFAIPLDPNSTRGSTLIGNKLFYAKSDGMLYQRSFSGSTFGAETAVEPYLDPAWSNVDTGSGQTFQGNHPSFYGAELAGVTSMFYADGSLYYTLTGQNGLYYRSFSSDSGIVAPNRGQVAGVTMPAVTGAFLAGDRLYYVTAADGKLNSVGFANGTTSGTPSVLTGAGVGSVDWRARVLFYGPAALSNRLPTAVATASCNALACNFQGSASTDSDGTITSYAWDFGDSGTSTQANPAHPYAAAGNYPVKLTVTDDQGGSDTATIQVSPAQQPANPVTFRAAATPVNKASGTATVTVPSSVQAGDRLLLFASSGTATGQSVPAGWSQVAQQASSTMLTTIWQRTATAADASAPVTVTLNSSSKVDVELLAYANAGAVTAQTAAAATGTSHAAPSATVTATGSWVLRYWADKSSTTTAWTAPGGVTRRSTSFGTGSGYITALLADYGSPVPSGASGTAVATTDAASGRDVTATVVIPPSGT